MNRINHIGLQLYTVREDMQGSFENTLKEVAAIGYKEVEFAGYFDHTPQDVRRALDQYRLTAPSAHVDYQSLESHWPQVIEAAQVIGHQYLVNGLVDLNLLNEPDCWLRVADTFNRAGEFSKQAGIQFAYHNHHFEFFPWQGKLPYDILLERCDPDLVKMEIDFCWMAAVEQDPLFYFQRYPNRFPVVHVKQLKKLPVRMPNDDQDPLTLYERVLPDITEVGDGVIDWKRIFSHSTQAGIRHFFVEHDVPQSPLASIQASYDYLVEFRI